MCIPKFEIVKLVMKLKRLRYSRIANADLLASQQNLIVSNSITLLFNSRYTRMCHFHNELSCMEILQQYHSIADNFLI